MRIPIVAACLLMLVGCNREEPAPASKLPQAATQVDTTPIPDTAPVSLEPLPARYSGVLPCADCTGIRYDIDLRPANVYFLRMTYMGAVPERNYDDIGTWSLASDLRTLALTGSRQSPLLFSINDASLLHKLDTEGQAIESELNYSIKRAGAYEPLAPLVPLRGMYSPGEAGAAVIEECTTGVKLQLDGPNTTALAEEFARVRKGATRPMLIAVEGTIESRPPDVTTLVANPTAKFWPSESCGARGVTHDLEGSRWVLVRLGDVPVMPAEGKAEPYIVLQSVTKVIVGHAGCNRLSGGYKIDGNNLALSELTTTRMACAELEAENEFLNALEAVARWRLMDNQLVLLDKDGKALAQLESRNL